MLPDSPLLSSRKPARRSQSGHISSVRKALLLRVDSVISASTEASLQSVPTVESAVSAESAATVKPDNYRLTRVGSNDSVNSVFSAVLQYRVTLDLNAKEISLLRYTWDKMLVEEPVEAKLSLPIPGLLVSRIEKPLPMPGSMASRLPQLALLMFCNQLYLNLLSMDPELEAAFPSLKHQAVSMASVLSLALNSLENLASLDDYLAGLGKRHLRILGIEAPQFELMGEALIQTFHERFGTRFTHELEVLWIKLYMYLANSLLQLGLDPVLKFNLQVYVRAGVYNESIFTADTDVSSITSRRMSDSTTATTVASSVGVKSAMGAPSMQKDKKKGKFGKKGDCVIV